MKVSIGKKYLRRRGAMSLLMAKNPVLVLGLDLPFVIACATSLRIAVAMSVEMLLIHMVTMVAAMITVRRLPMWSRMLVNVGVSFITMTFARYFITLFFPDIANYVGMYVYLMAVNGITVYQSAAIGRKDKAWPVLSRAFLNALAFALTMVVVSVLREYFSFGTLWGVAIPSPLKLPGLALPLGGFIIMGFLLAGFRFFNKKLLAFSIAEAMRQDARYIEIERRPMRPDAEHPMDLD